MGSSPTTMVVRLCCALAVLLISSIGINAQPEDRRVPWRFGVNLGLNYNMAGVGYANWITDPLRPNGQFVPYVMNDGSGIGPYLGAFVEYNPSWWGLQLRASFDGRGLTAKDDQSYKDESGTFLSDEYVLSNTYISFEPLFRINPFNNSGFHMVIGPGFGIRTSSSFDYTLQGQSTVTGVPLDKPTGFTFSFVGGFGWDIHLNSGQANTQWFLKPFVEGSYMTGQRDVSYAGQGSFDDALSTVTVRAGIGISFGAADPLAESAPVAPLPVGKLFRITPPADGIFSKRIMDEYYPLRPFVFFDKNNTKIPTRYTTINASETSTWAATSGLTADSLTNVAARPYRQGEVYYNILNVFGNRLKNSPSSTVELIGSDPAEKNGEVLANTVKDYFVNTWGIAPSRITVRGQLEPRIVSGSPRTPSEDLAAAAIENRRVEFIFSDPQMARRVQLRAERDAVEENLVYTELLTNENVGSWTATITGGGQRKTYGPYYDKDAYMDPTGLLQTGQQSGTYTLEVVAKTMDGRTLTDSEQFNLFRAAKDSKVERHSFTFEFGEQDPVRRSEAFLRGEVATRIANGSTVYIVGHTDNIGTPDVNMTLSQTRSTETRDILADELKVKGKTANIYARGVGEVSDATIFSNDTPEGRMYNRTVIVDIRSK